MPIKQFRKSTMRHGNFLFLNTFQFVYLFKIQHVRYNIYIFLLKQFYFMAAIQERNNTHVYRPNVSPDLTRVLARHRHCPNIELSVRIGQHNFSALKILIDPKSLAICRHSSCDCKKNHAYYSSLSDNIPPLKLFTG